MASISKCNGCSKVQIKTIHGEFSFPNQRFQEKMGKKNLDWLDYTEQFSGGYESSCLRSRCCHYANIMSYNEVSKLLKDETGVSLLSDKRIHAIIYS